MSVQVQPPAFVTGAAAITLTVGKAGTNVSGGYCEGKAFQIFGVYLVADAAFTQESLVITLDSYRGAAYDTVLVTEAIRVTDFFWLPEGQLVFSALDDVVITHANSDTNTVGLTVQWGKVEGGV